MKTHTYLRNRSLAVGLSCAALLALLFAIWGRANHSDTAGVVRAGGAPPSASPNSGPSDASSQPGGQSGAHVGDGVCATAFDGTRGARIESADSSTKPRLTRDEAIKLAEKTMVLRPDVTVDAFFADFTDPGGGHGGDNPGPLVRRPVWVVELGNLHNTVGGPNNNGSPPQELNHLMDFIDDATGAELSAQFCP